VRRDAERFTYGGPIHLASTQRVERILKIRPISLEQRMLKSKANQKQFANGSSVEAETWEIGLDSG
jgi:hypothetical protein